MAGLVRAVHVLEIARESRGCPDKAGHDEAMSGLMRYAAASVSACTMSETTVSTSFTSSPSAMTRITGSVPEGG